MRRTLTGLLVALVLAAATTGCDVIGGGPDAPVPPTSAPPSEGTTVDSQFTNDGTFQSHISVRGAPGIDVVYTLYPTKSTPRTNEWYPRGRKFFSFTVQAYDLDQRLRAPFATKRKVYLERVRVTSRSITADGGATQHPYRLNVRAASATFDPEPLTTKWGMLITSPKGAFELRNQAIGPMSSDTRGVELVFSAVMHIQSAVGSTTYLERTVEQTVPIEIFASDEATKATKIPVNAN